ncbi:MAG: hypothetical protein BGO98_00115 [Myxococcales bacterium 68-20]|nr:MAG: hypothetical protein BGO98_00115 [Myxococcales bacterium 68-20]
MRSVLLAGAASLFVVLATFACSSSTPAGPAEEDAGSVLKTDDPPPTDPDPHRDPVDDPAPTDAGATDDGGDSTDDGGFGTTNGDGGVQCQADSIRESEPNDTEATADAIPWKTGSFCGRLSGNDADVMTFTIPSSQNGFKFSMNRAQTGPYKIECSVAGKNFSFDGNYPYEINKPYFCKMSLTGAAAVDYRIDLSVTPN